MKAVIKTSIKTVAVTCVVLLASLSQASAERSFNYFEENRTFREGVMPNDVAACTTLTTNIPMPTYVCCAPDRGYKDMAYKDMGHDVHWISGSCGSEHKALGCDMNTAVNTTGAPILGSCQFSTLKPWIRTAWK